MYFRTLIGTAILLATVVSPSASGAAELTETIRIGEQVLKLNGAGTRSKAFVSLYESGLYLTSPSREAANIVAADELMAIRIRITSGFVSRSALASALNEGLEKSTGGQLAGIRDDLQMFHECLQDEVQKHDIYDFVYLPGKGLVVVRNGKVKGSIPGIEFKRALFGIWLSDDPVDANLKQAMLQAPRNR